MRRFQIGEEKRFIPGLTQKLGSSKAIMRQTVGFLACVASASAFLAGPAAMPGTARFNGAVNARSGVGLRAARPAVVLRKSNAAALSMQTATGVDTAALAKAANEARGLAMDSIAAAKSGHLGLPLGCAEVIYYTLSWMVLLHATERGCVYRGSESTSSASVYHAQRMSQRHVLAFGETLFAAGGGIRLRGLKFFSILLRI